MGLLQLTAFVLELLADDTAFVRPEPQSVVCLPRLLPPPWLPSWGLVPRGPFAFLTLSTPASLTTQVTQQPPVGHSLSSRGQDDLAQNSSSQKDCMLRERDGPGEGVPRGLLVQ